MLSVAFLRASFSAPDELYLLDDITATLAELSKHVVNNNNNTQQQPHHTALWVRQLTTFNSKLMESTLQSEAEDFWFKGADDELVHAWFFKPVGWKKDEEAQKKWPLTVIIHGGPQGKKSFTDIN